MILDQVTITQGDITLTAIRAELCHTKPDEMGMLHMGGLGLLSVTALDWFKFMPGIEPIEAQSYCCP